MVVGFICLFFCLLLLVLGSIFFIFLSRDRLFSRSRRNYCCFGGVAAAFVGWRVVQQQQQPINQKSRS